jgi:hypothetical protein
VTSIADDLESDARGADVDDQAAWRASRAIVLGVYWWRSQDFGMEDAV